MSTAHNRQSHLFEDRPVPYSEREHDILVRYSERNRLITRNGVVGRTKPQTDFTTPSVKPTPGYSKSTVSPSSYKHARSGYVCPYCSAGPLRVNPGGRYFRCPVCDEIADREVNTNIRA